MGLKLKLVREPNEELKSNPRAALRHKRNNGGTWTLLETDFTSYPAKGIVSCRKVISSCLYVHLNGTCSLAGRALLNTGEQPE